MPSSGAVPGRPANRRLRVFIALLGACAGLLAAAPAQGQAFQIGLTDSLFANADAGTAAHWLDRARGARAKTILLGAQWVSIAPAHRPRGFNPANPADPAYNWGTLDREVRQVRARGMRPAILVGQAPAWAEGRNRPSTTVAPGATWKPRPKALKKFALAIARRYSGGFRNLPRVRYFQLWAEPNLSVYLTPQWRHGRPVGALHYRRMLNAFYAGIKSVRRSNKVITGGTAPYGDAKGGQRMQPATFWRALLCLKGRRRLVRTRCREPAHFDIAAHNPINVGRPTRSASHPDDVSTPDIGTIRRILRKARRAGTLRPRRAKPIWATEIWWDSRPPDPRGVPIRRHARWLEESFYVLWRQGVKTVIWFQIRDAAGGPGSWAATQQTGLYTIGNRPKPALRAFRFPFVADRLGTRRVRLWGIAPRRGGVRVQIRRGGGWRGLRRLRAGKDRVFTGVVRLRGGGKLRARARGRTSLVWRLR